MKKKPVNVGTTKQLVHLSNLIFRTAFITTTTAKCTPQSYFDGISRTHHLNKAGTLVHYNFLSLDIRKFALYKVCKGNYETGPRVLTPSYAIKHVCNILL
ncbi:hypothetical protein ACF0H5_019576 [Mactra antiquata]